MPSRRDFLKRASLVALAPIVPAFLARTLARPVARSLLNLRAEMGAERPQHRLNAIQL